jgi:hypothetical protein
MPNVAAGTSCAVLPVLSIKSLTIAFFAPIMTSLSLGVPAPAVPDDPVMGSCCGMNPDTTTDVDPFSSTLMAFAACFNCWDGCAAEPDAPGAFGVARIWGVGALAVHPVRGTNSNKLVPRFRNVTKAFAIAPAIYALHIRRPILSLQYPAARGLRKRGFGVLLLYLYAVAVLPCSRCREKHGQEFLFMPRSCPFFTDFHRRGSTAKHQGFMKTTRRFHVASEAGYREQRRTA